MTYLLSILVVLILPACALGWRLRTRIDWRAFRLALGVIAVVGAAWSAMVTAHDWWSFGPSHVTGWKPRPNLLFEEVVFYPAGGALSILLYLAGGQRPARADLRPYLAYLASGTFLLASIGFLAAEHRPYYLYSQLVVYNTFVCAGLAGFVGRRIDGAGLARSTAIMTVTGYVWDHLAFSRGWWEYHAVTGWHLGVVPIDDFAFFLYAPAAAVSVYEAAQLLLSEVKSFATTRRPVVLNS